jgi:hypothetical protein
LTLGRRRAIHSHPDRSVDLALEAPVQHRFRIRRAGAVVAVALLAAACAASDENNPSPLPVGAGTSSPAAPVVPASPPPGAAPEVSAEDAMTIAVDAVGGGQVLETDADEFEVAIQVWEITVLAPDGTRRQVSVDMTTGNVMGNETD